MNSRIRRLFSSRRRSLPLRVEAPWSHGLYSPPMLDASEADRLRLVMAFPAKYVERRVETLTLLTHSAMGWATTHQIRPPAITSTSPRSPVFGRNHEPIQGGRAPLVLSIGLFNRMRIPDLMVTSSSGERVPLLSRDERSYLTAAAIFSGYLTDFSIENETAKRLLIGSLDSKLVEGIALRLHTIVARFADTISCDSAAAGKKLSNAYDWMARAITQTSIGRRADKLDDITALFIQFILGNSEFWIDISATLNAVHILAFVAANPDESTVLSLEWSDRRMLRSSYTPWSDRPLASTRDSESRFARWFYRVHGKGGSRARLIEFFDRYVLRNVIRILMNLALVPKMFVFSCQNAHHCESYYLLLNDEDDVDVVRLYWSSDEAVKSPKKPPSESRYPHISRYGLEPTRGSIEAIIEMQAPRNRGVLLATVLALIVAVISGTIAWRGRTSADAANSQVLPLVSFVPGAIAAAIGFYGRTMAASLALYLRVATSVVGIAAAGLGVALALVASGGPHERITGFDLNFAMGCSVLSLFVALWFSAVLLVPRCYSPNCVDYDFPLRRVIGVWDRSIGLRRSTHEVYASLAFILVVVLTSTYLGACIGIR